MCLIVLSFDPSSEHTLLALANRDEFYGRPARQAHFWEDEEGVLAGRDEEAGGTWLGVQSRGRFAAVTNYREPGVIVEGALSRGELVAGFLGSEQSSPDYMAEVAAHSEQYNGFNLLVYDGTALFYFSNRSGLMPVQLKKGIYGLSNHLLDTPWPKVVKLKNRFRAAIQQANSPDEIWSNSSFMDLLGDESLAADSDLPQTGVPLELERKLSAMLIKSKQYGTRCSTMVGILNDNKIRFAEKTIYPDDLPQPLVQFEILPTPDHLHPNL